MGSRSDYLKNDIQRLSKRLMRLVQMNQKLGQGAWALQEALREYGGHKAGCAVPASIAAGENLTPACSCGWTETLALLPPVEQKAAPAGETSVALEGETVTATGPDAPVAMSAVADAAEVSP